ncbi:MAG: riboflavin synthase [Sphingobacteriales bacterium]|nr:riboflavin synthase [Sphingobacteriales bacterium]
MFTGIIENTGIISDISTHGTNKTFWIKSTLSPELKVDQSVSHNGVCLTVEAIQENTYQVTAILETLQKTNLNHWELGTEINLERCMLMNGRLDGHIVQGHVDCTATCIAVVEKEGSWEYQFHFDKQFAHLVIEKGSISINGISLTCFGVSSDTFKVAIIPYTYLHTNIKHIQVESLVNIEFDLIGKYVSRMAQLK